MPSLPIYGNSHVFIIAQLCHAYGLRKAVISPGSRNAPLIKAFHEEEGIETYVIPDERSAAYFALGIARRLQEPVALVCTSGTAALNYSPALAEAFHQEQALLVISADRPDEWIGQNDGQTINQTGIFKNFIGYEARLPMAVNTKPDLWLLERAIRDAFTSMLAHRKSAHINVPLREPLYSFNKEGLTQRKATKILLPPINQCIDIPNDIRPFRRIIVVFGMQVPHTSLTQAIKELHSKRQVIILNENLSNIAGEGTLHSLDGLLYSIKSRQCDRYDPDLIISFGQMLVSKPMKQWLRTQTKAEHWIVSTKSEVPDTFHKIDRIIRCEASLFVEALSKFELKCDPDYIEEWTSTAGRFESQTRQLAWDEEWSDFKVFELLSRFIPNDSILHFGNSSVIRYAQFFDWKSGIEFYGNRGVSGIDGTSSTALGMATQTDRTLTLITGDVAFLYDSNAFWNDQQPLNFRIIVINNGGGNIFDLINGPSETGIPMEYFRTDFKTDIGSVCKAFNMNHVVAESERELETHLKGFFEKPGPSVLEIKTQAEMNTRVWKDYFAKMKNMK